jgi:hypothetical protein
VTEEQTTIKLRIDIDYPYPSSRFKSFLYIALGIKRRENKAYLKNAKIIAKMVNASPKQVKAYWFFTPYTIPDKQLLDLLNSERHEIALHVAKDAEKEWKTLEDQTNRTVKYYSIHGTSNLFSQLLWKRKRGQKQAKIPIDFPLKSFHDFDTNSLDTRRFEAGFDGVKEEAERWIREKSVISMHPEWLFKAGKKNRRGPYYDILKTILDVDRTLETLRIRSKVFAKIAYDIQEYEKNLDLNGTFFEVLEDRGIDIFTFLERKWCCPLPNTAHTWKRSEDNVGLLDIKSYDAWWNEIGKKTRNMVRRAEKSGVKVSIVDLAPKLAEGIWKIYNETPIRQGRAFSHYGESLQSVSDNMAMTKKSTFIGAYLEDELVGFIQIIYGNNVAIISQILSFQSHWDKSLNNALLAKAVEVCAANGDRWLMYGRIGNHPSLDRFKESNGFTKYLIARYYVPLTWKGKIAIYLGLHRELKDALPEPLRGPLIPIFNWISRNKALLRLRRTRSSVHS